MATISATGNFLGRPNRIAKIGMRIDYHFHNFDHTALAMAGLWRVRQFEWHEGDFQPDPVKLIATTYMAPQMFIPPGNTAVPWVLIPKDRWHSVELMSKTAYFADGVTAEVELAEFWCCFSLRDHHGEVVDYHTGWEGAFM